MDGYYVVTVYVVRAVDLTIVILVEEVKEVEKIKIKA